jgi:DNA-binding NarL/FixJ family response regulator
MSARDDTECVLLAGRHHGLSEGIRGLLETVFEVVIMVADETSLLESAKRLPASVAVVDLSLAREGGLGLLRRLRQSNPALKLIVISAHDQSSVSRSTFEAGADGFVLQRAIATDLLAAVDAVRQGQRFVSSSVAPHADVTPGSQRKAP